MTYIVNKSANTSFISGTNSNIRIDIELFNKALIDVHKIIGKITKDIPVDIFSILGMRNLSAFIGELFAISLIKESDGLFLSNPHQDGYPDLLLMDEVGLDFFKVAKENGMLRDKSPFSPFKNGGLEIKATCGSVPTPAQCAKKGEGVPYFV